jgi:hypothetical protein
VLALSLLRWSEEWLVEDALRRSYITITSDVIAVYGRGK